MITGGSSGIGLAVGQEFVNRGALVVIISRDERKLVVAKSVLASTNHTAENDTVAADVSNVEQITGAINAIAARHGGIDVLINCAGISTCARFKDLGNEQLEREMQVNYMGAVYSSKAAWPWLKASKGQLSFVSSVAGYIGVIGYSSYAPTKFAMTGLVECLRFEGRDDGIRVSIIYPPDTETAMMTNTRQHCIPETMALSKNIKLKSPEVVAAVYVSGLANNKFEMYCDLESRLVRLIKNNFPGITYFLTNVMIRRARKQQI